MGAGHGQSKQPSTETTQRESSRRKASKTSSTITEETTTPLARRLGVRDAVIAALQEAKATNEQVEFFRVWSEMVMTEEVLTQCKPRALEVTVATDSTYLEVCICGPIDDLQRILLQFAQRCGHCHEACQQLHQVVENTGAEEVVLWCRLKRIGMQNPAIDAGFEIRKSIDWVVADLLMPPANDMDTLRTFALQDLHTPSRYGASIFAQSPEQRIGFRLSDAPSKAVLSGLFFFKALGLMKPGARTMHELQSYTQAGNIDVVAAMGPGGLTRIWLTLEGLEKPKPMEMASALTCRYEEAFLDLLAQGLGVNVDSISFVAQKRGYVCGAGFVI